MVEKGIGYIDKRRWPVDERVVLLHQRPLLVRYEFILLMVIFRYFFVRIIFVFIPVRPGRGNVRLVFGRGTGVVFVILNKGFSGFCG